MATRKKKPAPVSPLAGRKARVCVERQGVSIVIDDVIAEEAGIVAADLLSTFRALSSRYPELRETPEVVPGGTPIDVPDDDGWVEERKRRVGF